ncbi:hypothetical protein ACWGCC_03880 [Streptomyces nigrescens]
MTRDPEAKAFRAATDRLPTVPFAQRWLIARGCPVDAIRMPQDHPFTRPADAVTAELEECLLTSASQRYDVLDHYSEDCMVFTATTLVRDHDPASVPQPFRIFHEEADLATHTHTLREGAWADIEGAGQWLTDRDGPLPTPHSRAPQAKTIPPTRASRAFLGPSLSGPTLPPSGRRR